MSEINLKLDLSEKNEEKENSVNEEKEKSQESEENSEERIEKEHEKYLKNPQTFQRKRDFFSFYSKNRNSVSSTAENKGLLNIKARNFNNEVILEKPEFKRFSIVELIPRGFGISSVKDKIEFFEKSMLKEQYKLNDLTDYQRKFYDNNEPRAFDLSSFKPERIKVVSFNIIGNKDKNKEKDNNQNINLTINKDQSIDKENAIKEKKEKENKKGFLNLVVDYSKIINSSKINKQPKELNDFLTLKKDKNKIYNNKTYKIKKDQNEELSLSFSSFKEGEPSTNFSHALNQDKKVNIKHYRQKSEICCYKDLLSKITETDKRSTFYPNLNRVVKAFQLDETKKEIKNDKYILVKKNNNQISVEKKQKFKDNNIKKVLYDSISDNMTLDRLDKAKYKLNQENNNNIIKNQIYEILNKLVIDNNTNQKKKNIKEKQKLNRAIEILPQLLLIKEKINTLLMNNENLNDNDNINLDENIVKKSVSSIYFLESIGLDPKILFKDKEKIENIKFIIDVSENIQLNGVYNKKKYLKKYFQNINKANIFLEILIDNINKILLNEKIPVNNDKQ